MKTQRLSNVEENVEKLRAALRILRGALHSNNRDERTAMIEDVERLITEVEMSFGMQLLRRAVTRLLIREFLWRRHTDVFSAVLLSVFCFAQLGWIAATVATLGSALVFVLLFLREHPRAPQSVSPGNPDAKLPGDTQS